MTEPQQFSQTLRFSQVLVFHLLFLSLGIDKAITVSEQSSIQSSILLIQLKSP